MSFLVAHEPAIRLAGFVSIFLILAILEVLLEARPLRLARSIRWRRNLGIDVSLGTRFHPLEMVLSMGIKFGAVAVLGAPVIAVVLFELMLNLSSLFTHANVLLPSGLDSMLRRVIVTPPMHRVHHSSHLQQTNSNFGFCLSIWDRIFGTYELVANAERAIDVGLREYRDPAAQTLKWMLTLPFRSVAGGSHADPDHSERPTLWHRAKL